MTNDRNGSGSSFVVIAGVAALLIGIAFLLLSDGFFGIPKSFVDRGQRIPSLSAEMTQNMEQVRSFLSSRTSGTTPDSAFLKRYAVSEGWEKSLEVVGYRLSEIEKRRSEIVIPILERDKSADIAKLKETLDWTEGEISGISRTLDYLKARPDALFSLRQRLSANSDAAAKGVQALRPYMDEASAAVSKSAIRHPSREADLRSRLAAVPGYSDYSAAVAELSLPVANRDVTVMDNVAKALTNRREEISSAAKALVTAAASLDVDWTRSLVDAKRECSLTLGRTTWNESSDSNTESEVSFPSISVPCAVLEAADSAQTSDGAIAGITSSGRYETRLDTATWNVLSSSVDMMAAWPSSSHDRGEIFIQDSEESTFHKYLDVVDGNSVKTDWVEVDPVDYAKLEGDLGMEVLRKPRGSFDDEAFVQQAPMGMSAVNDPAYGKWCSPDGSQCSQGAPPPNVGNSWIWLWNQNYGYMGSYRSSPMAYSEWSDWDRSYKGKRPFYGESNGYRRYGSYGRDTERSSAYVSSIFSSSHDSVRNGSMTAADAAARTSTRSRDAAARGRGNGAGGAGK